MEEGETVEVFMWKNMAEKDTGCGPRVSHPGYFGLTPGPGPGGPRGSESDGTQAASPSK